MNCIAKSAPAAERPVFLLSSAPVLSKIFLTLVVASALASCVRVQPYQRETLSKRSMSADKDASESRFEQHARGSREGSEGGTGEAGGGCGCN